MDILNSNTPVRICTKCNIEFPATLEYFHAQKLGKYGLCSVCIPCMRELKRIYSAKWRAAHREEHRAYSRGYYAEHHEERRVYCVENRARIRNVSRSYRINHTENIRAYNKAWREKHLVEHRTAVKEWREAHREETRAYSIAYAKTHREQIKHYWATHREQTRANWQRRRARKLGAGGSYSQKDVDLQYRSQKGKCWHCGLVVGDNYHVDHLIPLSRGGSNGAENIVIACPTCNLQKHDKMTWEWNGKLF